MVDKVIYTKPPKSPALAGVLSFFFPGTGSLYNREYIKGILYMLIFAGLVTLQTHGDGQPFKALIMAGFYIFQIIDAIQVAKGLNQKALTGEAAATGGEDFSLAVKTGSIFWGAALIVLGAIFLLGNFDIIDYDKMWRFWPVLVIGLGAKFIYDYYRRSKSE